MLCAKDLRVGVYDIPRTYAYASIGSNAIVEATDPKGEIRYFTYRDFALATGELLDNVDHAASDNPMPLLRRQRRRRATSSDSDILEVPPNVGSMSLQ